MKRKIILLGGKTCVVSLPNTWIKRFNLEKGDEIDVSEQGDSLIVKTDHKLAVQTATIDARELSNRVLRWVLSGAHKRGSDEIEILYEGNEPVEKVVRELTKDLFTGFQILDKTSKKLTLKSVSQDDLDMFESTMRRAFRVTVAMGQELLTHLHNPSKYPEIVEQEKINNQLTNFCERILITRGYEDHAKTCFMYVILWNLEKIADEYKYICESYGGAEISPELNQFFSDVNAYFNAYYELYYAFSLEKLESLAEERARLKTVRNNLLPENPELVLHLWEIVTKSTDFSTSMFCLKQ